MTPVSGVYRINTPVREAVGCFTYTIQPTGALTHTPKIILSGVGKIDWGDDSAQESITSGVAISLSGDGKETIDVEIEEI
jgi:hypothetical protein